MENNEKPTTDKVLEIDLGGVKSSTDIFSNDEMILELDKQNDYDSKVIKEQTSAPSNSVKSFKDQFSFYGGNLYVNINNAWTKISLSELVGGVIGTNTISQDTYINEDAASTNYGTGLTLVVSDRPAFARERQALLLTNLEKLNGTTISSALLYFYVESYDEWTTKDILIGRITQRWDDAVVTWGSAPSYTTSDGITLNLDNTDTGWQSVNITTIVQNWLNRAYDNFGLLIKTDGTGSTNEAVTITSSNATSNKPYIQIA